MVLIAATHPGFRAQQKHPTATTNDVVVYDSQVAVTTVRPHISAGAAAMVAFLPENEHGKQKGNPYPIATQKALSAYQAVEGMIPTSSIYTECCIDEYV